jgi:Type IV secretion system pilin
MNAMIKMAKRISGIGAGVVTFFVTTGAALAQNAPQGTTQISLTDPLGGQETFLTVLNNVAGFLFTDIAIPLATIMILVGAFQFMTGGGDPEKISKARKTIMYAAIGFAVALIASGASSIIKSILLNQ